jgi:hypothetical protein
LGYGDRRIAPGTGVKAPAGTIVISADDAQKYPC